MAGTTSAFVLVGEHSVGPFGSRTWRARHGIALIEKHRRVWMPTPVAHGVHEDVSYGPIVFPEGLTAAEELVIVTAACAVRDPDLLAILEKQGLLRDVPTAMKSSTRWLSISDDRIEHGPPIPQEVVDCAITGIRDVSRLGVVRTAENSDIDDESLLWLRSVGIDVDDFQRVPVPGGPDE